jgi:hypothetical protein
LAAATTEGTESPFAIAAIRVLILTGARLGEILKLQWAFVDLEQRALRLPDSKTGRKTIWLSRPAFEVLASVPRIENNPFVFAGQREQSHLVNMQKVWKRICRTAGITNARIHDLRHSYASVAVASGVGLAVTGKKRMTIAPDIPTVDEAGLPGFYASTWYALWAPRGVPPDVIGKLNAAVVAASTDLTMRTRFADLGLEIFAREQQTPEALRALQKAETEKWWPIIKAAGIKAE